MNWRQSFRGLWLKKLMLPASIPHPNNQTTLTFSLALPFTCPVFPFSSNFMILSCPDHSLILSTILWHWFSNNTCHNTQKIPAPCVERIWLGQFFPFWMTQLLVWQPQMQVLYFLISLESTGLPFSVPVHSLLSIPFHLITMLLNSPLPNQPARLLTSYAWFKSVGSSCEYLTIEAQCLSGAVWLANWTLTVSRPYKSKVLQPPYPAQGPAHSRHSIHICWTKEGRNE